MAVRGWLVGHRCDLFVLVRVCEVTLCCDLCKRGLKFGLFVYYY